ncbi:Hypothetical predicted protein [Cloeon dipterum]|uniref:Uncharacterized protein n=1 Tax=Cloeon dipterum TaxID=197152 RepID=A0A8S1CIA1_9INSE|nr:Hypothetical predicted protein [Cloeon dipterum]
MFKVSSRFHVSSAIDWTGFWTSFGSMTSTLVLTVPFASKREAEIVYDVLRVDEEPKRGGTKKTLKLNDSTIEVSFEAPERPSKHSDHQRRRNMSTGSRKEQQVHTPAPTPSRAIQGLVLYLGCLDFLPHKYWAVALPVLVCVMLAFTAFLIYPALGLVLTPSIEEQESFRFVPNAVVNRILFVEQ